MRAFTKKRSALGLAAIAALVMSVAAYAYFTASGEGTGTATTSEGTTFTVTQDSTISNLAPGKTAQAVDFTVTNDSADENAYLTTVKINVTVEKAADAVAGTCDASDYTLLPVAGSDETATSNLDGSITVAVGKDLVKGSENAYVGDVEIEFNNKATNQDACKSAAVTLNYVAA